MTVDRRVKEQRAAIRGWLQSGSINLFGLPFAGKDTQCELLSGWLKAPVVSGGDILRKRNDLPDRVRSIMNRGDLIPTEEYLKIVVPYLAQPDFTNRPLVLSAVGRFHGEEESVLQAAQDAGHPIRQVILLDLDPKAIWLRREASHVQNDRGPRADDSENALRNRLVEFTVKTHPVLDFYREHDLLTTINGDGTPDEVEAELLAALYKLTLA